jgi:hypothetical protein
MRFEAVDFLILAVLAGGPTGFLLYSILMGS